MVRAEIDPFEVMAILVSDQKISMPYDQVNNAFEPFAQG